MNYKIYIKEYSDDINIEDIIADYNSKATKKDCIKFYKTIYSKQMNFKE